MITRFAPSPTGKLHAGHAFSALLAWHFSRRKTGKFVLRMEDIDQQRCRPEFDDIMKQDLRWLGIQWADPVRHQSDHLAMYQSMADQLFDLGLLYPCFCTRREIQRELEAAGYAPQDNQPTAYPGTCRRLTESEQQQRISAGHDYSLRLNVERAVDRVGGNLIWNDLLNGPQPVQPDLLGDVILVRRDIGCSYHLCVTVDDALQNITHVIRGEDLRDSTHVHRLLQALLDLPVPQYAHHPLIRGRDGVRLAKRLDSETLQSVREQGISAETFLKDSGLSDLLSDTLSQFAEADDPPPQASPSP